MDASVALWVVTLATVAILTFVSNFFVFVAVYKCKKLQTRGTVFLLSLAASDFLVSCFNIPFAAASTLLPNFRPTGSSLCDISGFFEMTFLIASVFSVTAMNVHRCIHLVHWSTYYDILTKRRIILAVIFIWVTAVALSAPPLFNFSKISFKPGKAHCFVDWRVTPVYTFTLMSTCFFLPVCAMTLCYVIIYRFWKKSKRDLNGFTRTRGNHTKSYHATYDYAPERELPVGQVNDDASTDSVVRGDALEMYPIRRSKNSTNEQSCNAGAFVLNEIYEDTAFSNHIKCATSGLESNHLSEIPLTGLARDVGVKTGRKSKRLSRRKRSVKPPGANSKRISLAQGRRIRRNSLLYSIRKRARSCPPLNYRQVEDWHSICSDLDKMADLATENHTNKNIPEAGERSQCVRELPVSAEKTTVHLYDQPTGLVPDVKVVTNEPSTSHGPASNRQIRNPKGTRERQEEKKLTMMCIMIVAVFFISWFPFVVTMVLESLTSVKIPATVDRITLLIGYLNSLSNPLIYCYYNKMFRRQLKEQLLCNFKTGILSCS